MICVVGDAFFHDDVHAEVGDSVTIYCHRSDSKSVMWHYRNSQETSVTAHDVFDGHHLVNGYENKCAINNSTYALTIMEVEVADAGEYWCTEDEGFGSKHITELFVTSRLA